MVQQLGGFIKGFKDFLGLKRKIPKDPTLSFKRIRLTAPNPLGNATDDCMEIMRHSSPPGSSKSPCAFEGCWLKGFAFVNIFFFVAIWKNVFLFFYFYCSQSLSYKLLNPLGSNKALFLYNFLTLLFYPTRQLLIPLSISLSMCLSTRSLPPSLCIRHPQFQPAPTVIQQTTTTHSNHSAHYRPPSIMDSDELFNFKA